MDLEELFKPFGLISSAKVNDNGVAFVRYDCHTQPMSEEAKEKKNKTSKKKTFLRLWFLRCYVLCVVSSFAILTAH